MSPGDDDVAGPSTSGAAKVDGSASAAKVAEGKPMTTATGLELSAEEQALLEDDDDDVDLDALEEEIQKG
jgi:hypothetical protein